MSRAYCLRFIGLLLATFVLDVAVAEPILHPVDDLADEDVQTPAADGVERYRRKETPEPAALCVPLNTDADADDACKDAAHDRGHHFRFVDSLFHIHVVLIV